MTEPSGIFARTIAKISMATASCATSSLWTIALALYAGHLRGILHMKIQAFDVWETLALALAAMGFQLAALRVGLDHINHAWNSSLDVECAPQPLRWRVFGQIGAASWIATIAIGIPVAAGAFPHIESTTLIFGLVILLLPAIQCTGAAVVGPVLTHVIADRDAGQEARWRIQIAAEAAVGPGATVLPHVRRQHTDSAA
jgi:hypothetical protein